MQSSLKKIQKIVASHFEKQNKIKFVPGKSRIPIAVPQFGTEEVMEAIESMLSTWVTLGKKVKKFESMYSSFVGTRGSVTELNAVMK